METNKPTAGESITYPRVSIRFSPITESTSPPVASVVSGKKRGGLSLSAPKAARDIGAGVPAKRATKKVAFRSVRSGVLPHQALCTLLKNAQIVGQPPIEDNQVQPASLDVRLGQRAYRVRSSFLPGVTMRVMDKLDQFRMHEIDLTHGAVLESGCVYVIPLMEVLSLPPKIFGFSSPKSSTGRLDVFTRLIVDQADHFDHVPAGYHGPLYLEVAPRTFSILVRAGDRLGQLRLQCGNATVSEKSLATLQNDENLVTGADAVLRGHKIAVRVQLSTATPDTPVGYMARKNADIIDLSRINHYDPRAFWQPVLAENGQLILDPDQFYILASRESVRVPEDHSAEMIPYEAGTGAFRVHYAGFFDPGFGYRTPQGSKAVLEVRAYEVPFLLEDGQITGWLRYDRLTEQTQRAYGPDVGSSYNGQGLKLAKHFQAWSD